MKLSVSVIVRSFNRIPALLELLQILRSQDYNSFEIVIVEQSNNYNEEDWEELNKVCTEDQRIKLFKYDPLGGPQTRNEGVRNSSGEILIFVDDDDLPNSNNWISLHVKPYDSADKLVGFTARHIFEGNEEYPYLPWMRWFIRKKCMSYNWLKLPYTFAQFNEDVKRVGWLHGTNSSVRKEWALKVGLWDTHVQNQDEHSFAFKLQPLLIDGYRLDFRKEPALIRRMDIEGGMDKRNFSMLREWKNNWNYCSKIIFKYFPSRAILLPLYLFWCVFKVVKYIFSPQ